MNITKHFYHDKPTFGFDIGYSSLKAMQLDWSNKGPTISGYGVYDFDQKAVKDGLIVDPEIIAKAAQEMFKHHVIGDITTRRVILSLPAARTFNRVIKLPKLNPKELVEAIRTEAEQYIPVPIDELYLDYDIITKDDKEMGIFAAAVPKKIVDSYALLGRVMGLEIVAMETSIGAAGRLFMQTDLHDVPTVLIDFGSVSSDITIFDKTLVVTGTVKGGGDDFTSLIAEQLNVTMEEAHVIKVKYGLDFSKKQREIAQALNPMLDRLLKEIRRMVRYYEERFGDEKKISQIVTMGGGANMPGLNEYLTEVLRLPVRMTDPWQHLRYGRLQPPSSTERSMYVTACGLALIKPKEIFK